MRTRLASKLLGRDVKLLSLDVFGVALKRLVFHPEDVHRLVASMVGRHDPVLGATYVGLRLRAEELARAAAAGDGRPEISIADIGDELAALFSAGGRQRQLAPKAIACELDVEQHVARSNPEGVLLYEEAGRRNIPVAFTADSYLPRDFVAKLLQAASFRTDTVLVSSHEAATKASGELFTTLAERSGVAPDRILHVGPDLRADVAGAMRAGIQSWHRDQPRARVESSIQLGLTNRAGLDSVALAMAADRLSAAGEAATPADIGYYAGGPLAVGFAVWLNHMIGVQRPDHIVFCGPAGNVLRELMTTLDPELPPAKLHLLDRQRPQPPVPTGSWNDRSLDQLDRFVGSLPLDRHDRLLAVDLGWNPQPHTWLWEGMKLLGHDNRIDTALIGLIDRPTHHGPFQIWAFGADPSSPLIELARATTEVLDALLVEDGGTDQAPGLGAGIQAFAEDLEPWLALGPRTVTAALVEPALRIMHSPTYPEAQLLGRHQVRRDGSDEPVPLASLPPRSLLAKDPALLHQAGDLAPWPQGYRVLAAGDPTATSTRLARRVGRRRSGSVQPL